MSAVGAYFAKKRWNPTNLKNVEALWKNEEAEKEEKRRIEQLRREYDEERNREALEELQVKAGVKKTSTKMGWMYDAGPSSNPDATNRQELNAKEREAFLLGEKSLEEVIKEQKVDISKKSAVTLTTERIDVPFSQAELFVRMHEDPLRVIRQNQERSKAAKKAASRSDDSKYSESSDKRERKKKRKSSKHKKHKHRKRDRSSSEPSSSSSSSGENHLRKDKHDERDRFRDDVPRRNTEASGSTLTTQPNGSDLRGGSDDQEREKRHHERERKDRKDDSRREGDRRGDDYDRYERRGHRRDRSRSRDRHDRRRSRDDDHTDRRRRRSRSRDRR